MRLKNTKNDKEAFLTISDWTNIVVYLSYKKCYISLISGLREPIYMFSELVSCKKNK